MENHYKNFSRILSAKKFKIDKRRAHLSSLILSNQITREEVLRELEETPYDPMKIKRDNRIYMWC